MIYKILSLKLWCYGALYMFWPVKALLSSSSFTYSPTSKQTFSHTATHHLSLQLLWHSVCKMMTVRWLAFSLSSKRMLHFCTLKPNYFHVIIITDLASFCGAICLLYPLILAQSLAGGKAGYNPDSLQAMTRLMHKIHNHIHTYVEFLQLRWVVCPHTVWGNTHKHGDVQTPHRKGFSIQNSHQLLTVRQLRHLL